MRIYNATDINLNLHSSVKAEALTSAGDFVNPRTFEIAACGAFQLVDKRSLMGELFAKDELAGFGSMEELKEQMTYYQTRPEERIAMAVRAKARVLDEHTYAKRMLTLLDFAQDRVPGFGRHDSVVWPEQMPVETRAELKALMGELGLPDSADFEDLVTAVRTKNSQLSETETALLFLDEWKKLYLQ